MERKDLTVRKHKVLVCKEIADLLGIPQNNDIDYPYTHICRSIFDPCRISGIAFKTLESMSWQYAENCDDPQHAFDTSYRFNCEGMEIGDGFRASKGTNLKPGKLAAAVYPDASDQEISRIADKWANLLRESSSADLSSLSITNTPSKIYTLYSDFLSCMRSQDACRFAIYDDLSNTQLIYKLADNGEVLGRALLHNEVINGSETIKVMDRIYSDCALTESLFVQYTKQHGYYRKEKQSLGCCTYIHPKTGNCVNLSEIYIECDNLRDKYEQVPYVDTFCYYHEINGKYYLASTGHLLNHYSSTCMQNTDGTDYEGILTGSQFCCANCSRSMSEDDGIYVDGMGQLCDRCGEDYCYCECCNEYYHSDDVVVIHDEYYCEYHARRNFTLCEDCNEWHDNNDCTEVENYGIVCDSCRESSDYFYCDHCDLWFTGRETPHHLKNLDITVCDNCLSDFAQCEDCNDWQQDINLKYDTIERGRYCADCYSEIIENRKYEEMEVTI